jgi:pimeloyl-ACP methyl ester carboxylesterase
VSALLTTGPGPHSPLPRTDLTGSPRRSGRSAKPAIDYRFADHARYLDAFFDSLALDQVTTVGHDWGGALGFDWAARHPTPVANLAFMATIVRPVSWDELPADGRDMFEAFRRPGEGEELIAEQTLFMEALLPASMLRTLTDAEWDTCRQPFLDRAHRLPHALLAPGDPDRRGARGREPTRRQLQPVAADLSRSPSCCSPSTPARSSGHHCSRGVAGTWPPSTYAISVPGSTSSRKTRALP